MKTKLQAVTYNKDTFKYFYVSSDIGAKVTHDIPLNIFTKL